MAAGPLHSTQTANHILENWTYANATARTTATGFTSADLGKVAYQTDAGAYYRLTATAPTWALVGGGSGAGFALLAAANTFTVSPQTIVSDADAHKGLVVKGHSGTQAANLQEWQTSVGGFVGGVGPQGHAAFGNASAVNDGSLLYPGQVYYVVLTLEETMTDFSGDEAAGTVAYYVLSPSAAPSANFYGYDLQVRTDGVKDFAGRQIFGYYADVEHQTDSDLTAITGMEFIAEVNGGGDTGFVQGVTGFVSQNGAGTADQVSAVYGTVGCDGGKINTAWGAYLSVKAFAPGTIGDGYGVYLTDSTRVTGNLFGVWVGDQSAAGAANAYFLWYDAPGVYRVKADGVMAYYNPAFTKYTPGAANYERVVQQWNTNVLEYGLEAGGTGTLRKLKLLGTTVEVPGLLLSSGAGAGKVLTSDGSGNASWGVVAGTGTVTAVSVATANGFAGTSSGGATPALTLTTSITGVLKGNGTAISASNVTDDAQTKAAIVPNTAPTAGQILAGNAGNTAYAPVSMSGDATLASTGAITLAAGRRLIPTAVKTGTYTAAFGDLVMADASGGAFNVTLPAATGSGLPVAVCKLDTSGTAVTILRAGSDVIRGLVAGGAQTSVSVRGEGDIYWLVDVASGKWQVIDSFISPSYCDVYNSAQQTGVVTATHTSVTFGGTNSDPDSCFSSPTWTCKKAGVYDFSTTVQWGSLGAGAIGDIGTFVWKNGTGTGTLLTQFYTAQAASSNANPAQICAGKTVLVNGDTITVGVFQDSGSNKNLSPTTGHCVFQINRIGG